MGVPGRVVQAPDIDYDDWRVRRPLSRIVAVIAGAIVALCLAFLAGYADRGGARTQMSSPPAPPVKASKAPAAPSSEAATRAVPARDPGGLHVNAQGVIVGYTHTQGGAVAAAGNYTAALYVQRNRAYARELDVLKAICISHDDAVRMAGDFSSEDHALAKILDVPDLQSPGVIAYGHPVGYRVASFTRSVATVDVYVVGGQGFAGAPGNAETSGETFYEVDEVALVWRAGDWRMSNWSHLSQANEPQLASVAGQSYLPLPFGQAASE